MTLLHEQPSHGEVDRTDHHQPAGVLAMEEAHVLQRLGAIGAQDEVAELALLLRERLFLLLASQATADVEVGLALVAAEVQHLEGAKRLAGFLQPALHLDQPLARGVDGELAEVGGDPLAAELFCHGGRGATPAEKVRYQIACVATGLNDSLQQRPRLLRWIVEPLIGDLVHGVDVIPDIPDSRSLTLVEVSLQVRLPCP